MRMNKLVLAFGLAAALLFSIPASADLDAHGPTLTEASGHYSASDMLPSLPACMSVCAVATDATYALNDVKGKQGVVLVFRDFRTVADSGGVLA